MGLAHVRPLLAFGYRSVFVFLALCCVAGFSAVPAMADGVPPPPIFLPPAYQVTGAVLLVGNNVCAGLPCTETMAFSFDLGYEIPPPDTVFLAYIANIVDDWSGDLGSFNQSEPGPRHSGNPQGSFDGGCTTAGDANYLPFTDPFGDEIDINLCNSFVLAPVAPSITSALLFECRSTTCTTDFGGPGLGPPIVRGALLQYTVAPIPEPATLGLLACGFLVIGLEISRRKLRALKALPKF